EALRKARAIDPEDARPAYELGQVLQRGPSGVLFAPDTDLRGAVEAWHAANRLRHGDDDAVGLAHSLLWSHQWIAAETMARTAKPSEFRDGIIVAAITEAQGAAAAIAEASQLRTGDERTHVITRAMWLELEWRHYDRGRALFEAIRSESKLSQF